MLSQFVETEVLLMVLDGRPQHEVVQYLRDNFLDGELHNFSLQVDALYQALATETRRRNVVRTARSIVAQEQS